MIPVVFTHLGDQDYVQTAITQAQKWNQRVVLIGDHEFDVEFFHYIHYWDSADQFGRIYKHMSYNHERLERLCFQVYFMARDWALSEGIRHLFLADSDVMLYKDVRNGPPFAVSWCYDQWKYRWSACIHNSYWELPTLENMCNLITKTYNGGGLMPFLEEKWTWHQRNKVPGGVCDMTLLWFFTRAHLSALNQSVARNGEVWDDNINTAENYFPSEYRLHNGRKLLTRRGDGFYGYNRRLDGWVRFNSLHFQGGAKGSMKEYGLP